MSKVKIKKIETHLADRFFKSILKFLASGLLALLLAIGIFLFHTAWISINKFGWNFPFTTTWDPVRKIFGALPVIYGTILSSFIAVLIATPLSIGVGLFLTEVAPP